MNLHGNLEYHPVGFGVRGPQSASFGRAHGPPSSVVGLFCVSHCNIDGGNITVGMKQPSKEGEGNNDWIVSGVLRPPFPATEGGTVNARCIVRKGHLEMGKWYNSLRGALPQSTEALMYL